MEKYFTDDKGNHITRREWFKLIAKDGRVEIVVPSVDNISLETTQEDLAELTKFHNRTLKIIELAILGSINLHVDGSACMKVIIYHNGKVVVGLPNQRVALRGNPDELINGIRQRVVNNINDVKKMLRLAESTYIED